MKVLAKVLVLSGVALTIGLASGCHTVRGVGQDVQATGQVITGAAEPRHRHEGHEGRVHHEKKATTHHTMKKTAAKSSNTHTASADEPTDTSGT